MLNTAIDYVYLLWHLSEFIRKYTHTPIFYMGYYLQKYICVCRVIRYIYSYDWLKNCIRKPNRWGVENCFCCTQYNFGSRPLFINVYLGVEEISSKNIYCLNNVSPASCVYARIFTYMMVEGLFFFFSFRFATATNEILLYVIVRSRVHLCIWCTSIGKIIQIDIVPKIYI